MKKKVKKSMVMNKNKLNVIVNDEKWNDYISDVEELSEDIFKTTVSYLIANGLTFGGWGGRSVSVNLALSNDEEVRQLNCEFRGKDTPTNVLSFARIDDVCFENDIEHTEIIELGDIIVSLETLKREAKEQNILLKSHFMHLLVHGILHLYGYDHVDETDAKKMEDIEVKILKEMNVDNPYEE